MRTLKKTLCVVLALVMMVGLCVIGTSAVDFTDAEQINYKDAVALLTGIKVLNGIEQADGTFKFDPQGTLTRAQAAKIICFLHDMQDVTGVANFTDTKGHWAEGSIAYCARMGIVAGYGDGTFGPDNTLTGYQFGKMLLCALGYDADLEGLVGGDFEINCATLLKKAKLTAGIDNFDGTKNLPREQAAQMAYNALYTEEVSYPAGAVNVKTGDGTEVTVGGGAASGNGEWLYENFDLGFAWTVGGGKEADIAAGNDDAGRPTTQYLNADGTKVVAEVTDEPIAVISDGKFDTTKKPYVKWVDAAAYTYNGYVDPAFAAFANVEKRPDLKVEFYGNVAGGVTTITDVVITQKYFATITAINATTKDISVDFYDPIAGAAATTWVVKYDKNADEQSDNYKALSGFAKNDVIELEALGDPAGLAAVPVVEPTIVSAKAAEGITGKITAKAGDGSYVKVDGKQYNVSAAYDPAGVANLAVDVKTGTWYVDELGCIFGYVAPAGAVAAAQTDFLYMQNFQAVAFKAAASDLLNPDAKDTPASAKAEVILTDGTHTAISLALSGNNSDGYKYTKPNADGTATANTVLADVAKTAINRWFAFSKNDDGTYVVEAIDAQYAAVAAADAALAKGTSAAVAGKNTVSTTKIVSIDTKYKATIETGLVAANLKYKGSDGAQQDCVLVTYAKGSASAAAIYAVLQAAPVAPAVTTDYAYAAEQGDDVSGGTEWTFYVDGAAKTYVIKTGEVVAAGNVYKLTKDASKDLYTVTPKAADVAGAAVTVADTTFFIAGGTQYNYASNAKVINIVGANPSGALDTIKVGDTVNIFLDGGKALIVYITARA